MTVYLNLKGKCPCGGTINFSDVWYGIAHTVPICDAFSSRDPEQYLAWLNGYHDGYKAAKEGKQFGGVDVKSIASSRKRT